MSPHASMKKLGTRSFAPFYLALLLIALLAGEAVADASKDYTIRPQTRLKVAIVEWIAATGEYKEWTALNGEYSVSSAGTISIPLIGEIKVLDETTAEVEIAIGDLLKAKTGLASVPVASVEVSRYPMVYVTGAVDRSGEFEYRPGMTAMQAVAMAGGRERKQIPTGGYSEVDQIRYLGELSRYQLMIKQLLAKRARLQAEINEAVTVQAPSELATDSEGDKRIMDVEIRLFLARTQALSHQLDALDDLKKLLGNEIKVLDEKMTVQERQISIAAEDLKVISKLYQSKALARSQLSSSERLVADLRSSMLDLNVASMRAKQKLSETERDALTLKGQHRIEAGRDLQSVEADIEDTRLKRDTMLQVLQITGASVSQLEDPKLLELLPIEYWITHASGGRVPVQATQSTLLEPGDLLDVRLSMPANGGEDIAGGKRQTQ
jgi:protein involved in polysaccharide export with SLBB domain